jgi:hypothetical protein
MIASRENTFSGVYKLLITVAVVNLTNALAKFLDVVNPTQSEWQSNDKPMN